MTTDTQTCETCQHWKPPSERADFTNIFSGDVADKQFGYCQVIGLPGYRSEPPDPLPLAVTQDGSGYFAGLFTQAAFGCAMWEAVA